MAGTLNDEIRRVTGGQTVNDGLLAYYRAQTGVPGGTLNDQERGFLILKNLLTPASAAGFTNDDLWMRLTDPLFPGAGGTTNDRQLRYWSLL